MQSMAPRIVQWKSGHEVIAYGGLERRRIASGEFVETVPGTAPDVRWELALGTPETSGRINEVEELQ
jgi:hypothetical protein